MTDTRFTTVARHTEELLAVTDIDEVDDLETLLMMLFARPMGLEEVWETDESESSLKVTVHGELTIGTVLDYPMSVVGLVRDCVELMDEVGPYTRADAAEAPPNIAAMGDDELIAALQEALGRVRLYKVIHGD